jgi:hypothetical protein
MVIFNLKCEGYKESRFHGILLTSISQESTISVGGLTCLDNFV